MIKVPVLKNQPSDIMLLNRYLTKATSQELSFMLRPCHTPKMVSYYGDIKKYTGIDESDIKDFFNNLPSSYIKNFAILTDKITSAIFISIIYYLRIKSYNTAKLLFYFLGIRFHSNNMSKMFKLYCKEGVWESAMNSISQKHLYKVKGGISNSTVYLIEEEYKKRKPILENLDLTEQELLLAIYMLRTRLAQSLKSFAETYYKIEKLGNLTSELDEEGETQSDVNIISDKVSESICTYSSIDKKAVAIALIKSRIRKEIGENLIKNLSKVGLKQEIKFLVMLMYKFQNLKDLCVETTRMSYVRKLISTNIRIGNYKIKDYIIEIAYKADDSNEIQTVNRDQIALFLIHYFTLYIKKFVC